MVYMHAHTADTHTHTHTSCTTCLLGAMLFPCMCIHRYMHTYTNRGHIACTHENTNVYIDTYTYRCAVTVLSRHAETQANSGQLRGRWGDLRARHLRAEQPGGERQHRQFSIAL